MDQATKDYLGYADKDNGEWWMAYDDFIHHFNDVTICTVGPDFDNDGEPSGDRFVCRLLTIYRFVTNLPPCNRDFNVSTNSVVLCLREKRCAVFTAFLQSFWFT